MTKPPMFESNDAFFFGSRFCNKHFLTEEDRDEHEKARHSKKFIEERIHEIVSEIPDLEDK